MATPAAGESPSAPADWCTADERGRFDADRMPERFSREECDVRGKIVFRRAAGLTVHPEVGYAVWSETHGVQETSELSVTTTEHGFEVGDSLLGTGTSSGSPGPCDDYTQGAGTAYKVGGSYPGFYIRTPSIPSNVGTTNGVNAIRNALTGVVSHANDCGEARNPNVDELPYNGAASNTGNFTSGGDCTTLDSVNVVDFGVLSGDAVARFCLTYVNGRTTAYDVRMDSEYYWDYTLTDGCHNNNAWDITGVLTHEWGHVYGLSHVAESSSGNLTMSTAFNGKCQVSERTLGRGDMDHMFAKYGYK
jgi:hypothetical protein